MKKRLIAVLLMFLVVMSTITFAEDTSTNSCSGFFGTIKCFLWGNPENRAGQSWWDRTEALTGN